MRKGLLTEVIEAFRDAGVAAKAGHPDEVDEELARLDALRDEVLRLLREGDRLKRRAENAPPSSKRSWSLQDAFSGSGQAGAVVGPKDAS